MTVVELRELLAKFDDDADVYVAYQYGDRRRTFCAGAPHDAERKPVKWSEYHDSHVVADEDDENHDGVAVVISLE